MRLGLLIGGNVFEQLYVMPGCRQAGGIATWKAFNTRNVASNYAMQLQLKYTF